VPRASSVPYGLLFSVPGSRQIVFPATLVATTSPMPGVRYQEVRSLVSMTQVLELLGFVAQEATRDERRGACPVHGSSSPKSRSFSANVKKGVYRCFGCGSAGNHLDLYAAVTQQSLHAAAVDLCQRVGCAVPWIGAK
jgi:DNA primase